MRISRNSLAFMSVLAAGVLLAGATVLLPSAKTYGSETDEAIARELAAAGEANAAKAAQPAPSAQQPAPPAAPVENPAGATGATAPEAAAPSASPDVQLPNTGTGGYTATDNTLAYLFIGLGLALMGSGSLVWAYGRKRR
jgi:hypothetical protein